MKITETLYEMLECLGSMMIYFGAGLEALVIFIFYVALVGLWLPIAPFYYLWKKWRARSQTV